MAKKSYKQMKNELENIMAKLQDDDIDIDEAIKLHKQGSKVLSQMQNYLKEVKLKIKDI